MASIAEYLSPDIGSELDSTGYKALVEAVWYTSASMQPWDPVRESMPGLRVNNKNQQSSPKQVN